jgi:hypothetical protein
MKKIFILAFVVSMAAVSFAQTIDDFEGYADSPALQAVWTDVAGFSIRTLQPTGGANATSKWMYIEDGGFSAGVTAPAIASPGVAGGYKLTFYWQNGQGGGIPWDNLTVKVIQNAVTVASADLGTSSTSDWKAGETLPANFTTDPITIELTTPSNGAAETHIAGFDEFELVSSPVPVFANIVTPDTKILSGANAEILVSSSGGSEVFTMAELDLGDDASIEQTDNTEPYSFTFDTTALFPGTTGSLTLRVDVTDDLAVTGSDTKTYLVDNRYNGRPELVTNGSFDNFTGNDPDGWVHFQDVPNATTVPGNESHDFGTTWSLQVTFAAGDFTNRYTWRIPGVQINDVGGNSFKSDFQVCFWGKGSSCRMAYFTSPDDTVWTNAFNLVNVNSGQWTMAVGGAYNPGDAYVSVATHMFNAETCYWDDVSLTALDQSAPSNVSDWNLY